MYKNLVIICTADIWRFIGTSYEDEEVKTRLKKCLIAKICNKALFYIMNDIQREGAFEGKTARLGMNMKKWFLEAAI